MKLVIGVPSGDMVHADFAMSLAILIANSKHDIMIANVKTALIQRSRHDIVKQALELGADKLLFLDSDMIFPADVIDRLVKSKKTIIGCNASTRTAPFKSLCKDKNGDLIDIASDKVEEVGYIGTGCLLIDMKVFYKIGEPYFNVIWGKDSFLSEDYNFSVVARELGFKIFCDSKMSKEIKHIGVARYSL